MVAITVSPLVLSFKLKSIVYSPTFFAVIVIGEVFPFQSPQDVSSALELLDALKLNVDGRLPFAVTLTVSVRLFAKSKESEDLSTDKYG